jgi:hypothetical protein
LDSPLDCKQRRELTDKRVVLHVPVAAQRVKVGLHAVQTVQSEADRVAQLVAANINNFNQEEDKPEQKVISS